MGRGTRVGLVAGLLGTAWLVVVGRTVAATEGPRPLDALARGAERGLGAIGLDGISLAWTDVAVAVLLLGVAAIALWPRRRRGLGPIAVVVEASTDDRADGPALAAVVRDRLGRVQLQPPVAVPASQDDVTGLFSAAAEAAGAPAGLLGQLVGVLRPRPAAGFEARLTPRPSSRSERRGLTVHLADLDRHRTLLVNTIFEDTYEQAARTAAYQVASVLLRELPRRQRRRRWWRWDASGRSLMAYEEGLYLVRMRRYDEAVATLREGLDVDPSNLALRLRLGTTLERVGAWEEALWTYSRVVENAHRPSRSAAWTREAALVRWRTAIVLSNADLWADGWLRRLAGADGEAGHTLDKRLRGWLADGLDPARARRDAWPSLHASVLPRRPERARRTRPSRTTEGRFPFVASASPSLSRPLGLFHDHGLADLLAHAEAVTRELGSERVEEAAAVRSAVAAFDASPGDDADACALRLVGALRAAAAAPGVPDDARTRCRALALALDPAAWARTLALDVVPGPLLRRRAGLRRSDRQLLAVLLNLRQLTAVHGPTGASGTRWVQDYRSRAARRVDRVAWWHEHVLARLARGEDAHRRRSRVAYNAACTLAALVPDPGEDVGDAWLERHEPQVGTIVELLRRAVEGPGNLVEAGGAAWLAHEDPDLATVRRHHRFCRFAASVLGREVTTHRVTAGARAATQVRLAVNAFAPRAEAAWRGAADVDVRAALALVDADREVLEALAAVQAQPTDHDARHRLLVAMRAMDPDTRGTPRPETADTEDGAWLERLVPWLMKAQASREQLRQELARHVRDQRPGPWPTTEEAALVRRAAETAAREWRLLALADDAIDLAAPAPADAGIRAGGPGEQVEETGDDPRTAQAPRHADDAVHGSAVGA